jgi:hypothetical protein
MRIYKNIPIFHAEGFHFTVKTYTVSKKCRSRENKERDIRRETQIMSPTTRENKSGSLKFDLT